MKFKDLLKKYSDKEILDKLFKIYPDQKNSVSGYESVLKKLRKLKPIKSRLELCVSWKEDEGKYLDVKGFDGKTTWAIEFTKWEEWLDMRVNCKINELDFIAGALWEMTYCGYEQKTIQAEIKEIRRRMKTIKELK
jgi:hypothetical protein